MVEAFNTLPIELNKHIAGYLESDQDICNFKAVCRATLYAIDEDGASFWRRRFKVRFALDPTLNVTSQTLRQAYQYRRKILKRGTGVKFHLGWTKEEQSVMTLLVKLINQSFEGATSVDKYGRLMCPNMKRLAEFIRDSRNLLDVKRLQRGDDVIHPGLAALQLMCSHFLFDGGIPTREIYPFELSQKVVYESINDSPMFLGFNGSTVNMAWTLHCLNFFRHHMVTPEAQTLHDQIDTLHPLEKPAPWQSKLKNGPHKLPCHWKGTYAYLERHEVDQIRFLPEGSDIFIDKNVEAGGIIQTIKLNFDVEKNQNDWPKLFERHLKSITRPAAAKTRAQHKSSTSLVEASPIPFDGQGEDDESFFAQGWLNPLPPQPAGFEIPGWQRITFMKHFHETDGSIDFENMWSYEGVVLPGDRLILGRWWYADPTFPEEKYSGPFIFWAVEDDKKIHSTWEFESDSDADAYD